VWWLSSLEGVLYSILAELYLLAGSATTVVQIPIPFPGGCWAQRQLRNSMLYVPATSRPRISLTSVEAVVIVTLTELCSMADPSTTARLIPIPVSGGCWTRHQLHNGIKCLPVALKPQRSLSSVQFKLAVTASSGVAVLQRDNGIDCNQTGGINEVKYRRHQHIID